MPSRPSALAETLETRRLWAAVASSPFIFGGGGFDNAQKTVQTRAGDLIVAGEFSGSTNFAPKGQRAAVLTARGDTDVYVADYAANGSLKWVVQIGGDYHSKQMSKYKDRDIQINQTRFTRYEGKIGGQPRLAGEYVNDIAVDDAGNIYLAGAFRSTIQAGRYTLTADQTFTSSYYDALVMKISAGGSISWAKQFGGAFDDDATSIGVDAKGNAFIGGYYTRQIDVDPSSSTHLLETDGRDAGFVLRLTTDGNFGWVYQFDSEATGTDERNAVNDLVVTRAGEVYFDGSFADKARFTPGSRDSIKAQGKTDSFVAALNRKGSLSWVKTQGGDDYDGNSAIALDADGNVYTAGYFTDEADVNPDPNVETTYQSTPEDNKSHAEFSDLLVSKFDSSGHFLWADQVGGEYIELAADLTVGADGGVYLTGSFFGGAMDADPGRGTYDLASARVNDGSIKDNNTRFGRDDSYDWFVDKLSPRGKFVAAERYGNADDDYAAGLTQLADGTLLLSGRQVDSTVPDRDDRQEQSVLQLISPQLHTL